MKKEVDDEKGGRQRGKRILRSPRCTGDSPPVDEAAAAFLGRRACAAHAQGASEEIGNARGREGYARRL